MSENNTASSRRLLTQTELAEYLQVPVRTIEDWRTRDYGPKFLRVGRRVRYRESDVDAWLDAQEAA
ncbi:excisionase family DNA binding protein [Microbacterium marinum]|jgi:excisionase family DNA binding protein|uniref:Excisionase family DNA binding protein n=1 Tax=Microbacterium marinum TaxID=421115 RepID=A0A7W7BRC7_9MICO|nr:helix-turn-helix domain-containing protein [Microbacterium marinum]MBB4667427.1 excisionase family DNA binding protein [Microbacterium marinum]